VTHFFNPSPSWTWSRSCKRPRPTRPVVERAEELIDELGKTRVTIDDDPGSYGFLANRCHAAMREEAQRSSTRASPRRNRSTRRSRTGYNLPVGPFSLTGIGEEWTEGCFTAVWTRFSLRPTNRHAVARAVGRPNDSEGGR